jgi:hypothetical protein
VTPPVPTVREPAAPAHESGALRPRLLTSKSAADYLSISTREFQMAVASDVPCITIGQRARRWAIDDLDRWIDAKRWAENPPYLLPAAA